MRVPGKYFDILIFTLPIISVLFIFRNIIFTDSITYNGDFLFNYYPYFYYFSKGAPLIIQEILSGFPGFVTVSGIWFYPLNKIAFSFLNPIYFYKYMTVINILLTYVFTYLYAKKMKFSHLTAIFISSVFVFSGQLMQWSDTLLLTSCYFTLPLALYLFEISLEKTSRTKYIYYVLSGMVLGFGWLSSQPQFVVYQHIFFLVYILFKVKKIWVPIIPLVVSFLVGFQQIIAILAFKADTFRVSGVPVSEYFIGAYLPQDLIHYVLPFFTASPKLLAFGSPNLYIGILPIILLLFSFFIFKKIQSNLFKFYFFVFIFSILASIKYSPVAFLMHILPVLDNFREAPRIMFIGEFAAAFIVGFSLDHILLKKEEINLLLKKYLKYIEKVIIYIFTPIIIIVSLLKIFFFDHLLNFANNLFIENIYSQTSKLPIEYYFSVIKIELNQLLNQFYILDFSVIIALIFIIASLYLLSSITTLSEKHFLIVSILLVLLNFSFVYAFYYKTVSIKDYLSVPNTALFIKDREKNNKEPFRIYSVFPNDTVYKEQIRCGMNDQSESLELQKELIVPNLNILYDLDVADGYDQFTPRNISILTAKFGSERAPTGPTLASEKIPIEEKIKKIVSMKNVFQMMNVKYIISHYEIKDIDFNKVYAADVGRCGTIVYVYELKNHWPRYYLSNNNDKVSVPAKYNKNGMDFVIDTTNDTNLYVGNTFLSGWRVSVDGEWVEISNANQVYMSIPVKKGNHEISFIYKEPSIFNWLKK